VVGQGRIQALIQEPRKMQSLSGHPPLQRVRGLDLAKSGEARGEKRKHQCLLSLFSLERSVFHQEEEAPAWVS